MSRGKFKIKSGNLEKQLRAFEEIKKEFLSVGLFKKGTISKRWMTCGRTNCKCHSESKYRHGPYYWWTSKQNNKTYSILVPHSLLKEAKAYLKNYQMLCKLFSRLEQLSERIVHKKINSFRKAK